MDEREPRNRRLGARLQFAENLLSSLLDLSVGSFKLFLRLGLKLMTRRDSPREIFYGIHLSVKSVDFAQICLDFCAFLLRLDAAFHGLLANFDQLADPIGMVLQIAGNAAEVGLDRIGRRSLQAEIGGNPLVDSRDLFEFAPDVVQMAVRLLNRRRIPRLDAVEPVSIGSRHYLSSFVADAAFATAATLPLKARAIACIPWGAMYSNFESRASSWSM